MKNSSRTVLDSSLCAWRTEINMCSAQVKAQQPCSHTHLKAMTVCWDYVPKHVLTQFHSFFL